MGILLFLSHLPAAGKYTLWHCQRCSLEWIRRRPPQSPQSAMPRPGGGMKSELPTPSPSPSEDRDPREGTGFQASCSGLGVGSRGGVSVSMAAG